MDALARRVKGLGEIVDNLRHARLAGAAFENFVRDGVGLEHALRRQQYPATLRLVVREPHAARQPRMRGIRHLGRRLIHHLSLILRMILSENRFPLFGIMRSAQKRPAATAWAPHRRDRARPAWPTAPGT